MINLLRTFLSLFYFGQLSVGTNRLVFLETWPLGGTPGLHCAWEKVQDSMSTSFFAITKGQDSSQGNKILAKGFREMLY